MTTGYQISLWGDEFKIQDNSQIVQNKLDHPKDIKKTISSKKVDIDDKLLIIKGEVNRILGRYKNDTVVIKTKEELIKYIDKSIENKVIAIDTETNNSLDPITCKLMGPCLYTPGMKNAYIPINHVNRKTGERLPWQLTEQDILEQFSRLDGIDIITHNGKFDYEVLYCTTGWKMPVTWDTMIGARLLNENEKAGLKEQYRTKIDITQEKYDIEHLFQKLEYAIVDPDLFALYAATDSYMTYKLYLYQKSLFDKQENSKLYNLFKTVELPVMFVSAQMELDGICVDQEYAKRLQDKYHKQLDELQVKLNNELHKLDDVIDKWRKTPEANYIPIKEFEKRTDYNIDGNLLHYVKGSGGPGDPSYWFNETTGKQLTRDDEIKFGLAGQNLTLLKTKNEQLTNPVKLTSSTQLAILFYDVLKHKPVNKKSPRSTGEEALEKLKDDIPICNLILEQRGLLKLIDAFIDTLPKKVSPKDGRLHSHFNQLGTDTGRFSSSDPNLQQIPSKNKEIRMLFCAQCKEHEINLNVNTYCVPHTDEIEVDINTWKLAKDLKIGDKLLTSEKTYDIIKNINYNPNTKEYIIYV